MDKCRCCLDGCIHLKFREVPGEHARILHDSGFIMWGISNHIIRECELYPEKYHSWMEEFGQMSTNMLTEKEVSCFNECYEASEIQSKIQKCNDAILDISKLFLNTIENKK